MAGPKWFPSFTSWRDFSPPRKKQANSGNKSNQDDQLIPSAGTEPGHTAQNQIPNPDGNSRPSSVLSNDSGFWRSWFGPPENNIELSASKSVTTPSASADVGTSLHDVKRQGSTANTAGPSTSSSSLVRRSTNRRRSGVPVTTPGRIPFQSKSKFFLCLVSLSCQPSPLGGLTMRQMDEATVSSTVSVVVACLLPSTAPRLSAAG